MSKGLGIYVAVVGTIAAVGGILIIVAKARAAAAAAAAADKAGK